MCYAAIVVAFLIMHSILRCGVAFIEPEENQGPVADLGFIVQSHIERFQDLDRNKLPNKSEHLLVFISITSSPERRHLRHGARYSWLLPCLASPLCNYRFFIDRTPVGPSDPLEIEYSAYGDMVFRDTCSLMERHPHYINYGNSPPVDEHMTVFEKDLLGNDVEIEAPDYRYRRLYKIDWKVCFMQWALKNGKMAEFNVFVEDDSFMCVENFLHQAVLLVGRYHGTSSNSSSNSSNDKSGSDVGGEGINEDWLEEQLKQKQDSVEWISLEKREGGERSEEPHPSKSYRGSEAGLQANQRDNEATIASTDADSIDPRYTSNLDRETDNGAAYNNARSGARSPGAAPSFRTGYTLFDGFDDSSTIMTKDIAIAFAQHYPEPGFDCGQIADSVDEGMLRETEWLSWGNSWTSQRCDWFKALRNTLNMTHTIHPTIDCMMGQISAVLAAPATNTAEGNIPLDGAAFTSRGGSKGQAISFPCMERPLIFHHPRAAETLLAETPQPVLGHMCEFIFLIDKVKKARLMLELWNQGAVHNTFHDFSEVFLHEDQEGWVTTLSKLSAEEDACIEVQQEEAAGILLNVDLAPLDDDTGQTQRTRKRRLRNRDEEAVRDISSLRYG